MTLLCDCSEFEFQVSASIGQNSFKSLRVKRPDQGLRYWNDGTTLHGIQPSKEVNPDIQPVCCLAFKLFDSSIRWILL